MPVSLTETSSRPTFGIRSRSDRQFATGVFHGLDRVQHQVHEDLLKLHPVCQDLGRISLEFAIDRDGVPIRFGP